MRRENSRSREKGAKLREEARLTSSASELCSSLIRQLLKSKSISESKTKITTVHNYERAHKWTLVIFKLTYPEAKA